MAQAGMALFHILGGLAIVVLPLGLPGDPVLGGGES